MTTTEEKIDAILGRNQPRREMNRNRFGVMVYDHKTAGSCQVLNSNQFGNVSKYNVGRNSYGSNLRRFLK